MEHTPGPWKKVNNPGFEDRRKPSCTIWPNNNNIVHDPIAEVPKIEDARIIAAAPEMIEALIWFCRRVEKGEVRSRKTYGKYKAIIEKATGQTWEELTDKSCGNCRYFAFEDMSGEGVCEASEKEDPRTHCRDTCNKHKRL